jgi:hypothetical protein
VRDKKHKDLIGRGTSRRKLPFGEAKSKVEQSMKESGCFVNWMETVKKGKFWYKQCSNL